MTTTGEPTDIRPTLISNDASLHLQRPRKALFYIVLCCFHQPTRVQRGLALLASPKDTIRAWSGGFGNVKVGANYGPTLPATEQAKRRGLDQVLWLLPNPDGSGSNVTEVGSANFFVVWRTEEGHVQLVTAPLDGQVILEGVTRRSVLELARERLSDGSADGQEKNGKVEVVERCFTMEEFAETWRDRRVIEAFAVATGLFVRPVAEIHLDGETLSLGASDLGKSTYAALVKRWLEAIMYEGDKEEWAWCVEE